MYNTRSIKIYRTLSVDDESVDTYQAHVTPCRSTSMDANVENAIGIEQTNKILRKSTSPKSR